MSDYTKESLGAAIGEWSKMISDTSDMLKTILPACRLLGADVHREVQQQLTKLNAIASAMKATESMVARSKEDGA